MKGYGTRSLISLTVVAALLLIACGATSVSPIGAKGGTTTTPVQSQNSSEVKLPKDFQVEVYRREEVLGGKTIQFSHLFGQGQPVVLNFFAGLCPPCRVEMPDFQVVSTQYQDRATIFGLDIGPFIGLGSQEDGKALVQELGITYATGTTFDNKVVEAYRVLGMPTTVFFKPDGKVFKTWTGILTRDKLVELTEELLKASGR